MNADYQVLSESFLDKLLSVNEFEKRFLRAFKSEPAGMDSEAHRVLDKLFSDVDSYSADCKAGKESGLEISEVQLRRQAAKALNDLRLLRDPRPLLQR